MSHWITKLFKKNVDTMPEIMLYLKILHLNEPMDLVSLDLSHIPSDSIIPDSILNEFASMQQQLWKEKFDLCEEECLAVSMLIKHQTLTSRELVNLLASKHVEIPLIDGWLHRLIRKMNSHRHQLIKMIPQGTEILYQWVSHDEPTE